MGRPTWWPASSVSLRRVVLDAGCGTGRVAIELARRGYDTVGIDVEPSMLDAARAKAPELEWILGDLSSTVLPDSVVRPRGGGRQRDDLPRARHRSRRGLEPGPDRRPGGLVVAGFQVGRQLTLERYDALAASAGLELAERWATWEQRPTTAATTPSRSIAAGADS